eukprot:1144742-Pelagomonas_calceolata.AAC.1
MSSPGYADLTGIVATRSLAIQLHICPFASLPWQALLLTQTVLHNAAHLTDWRPRWHQGEGVSRRLYSTRG